MNLKTSLKRSRLANIETLEVRTALDGSGLLACPLEFEDSPLVTEREDGTLRFASLNVGKTTKVLDDREAIIVRDYSITVGQTKELLHGFADSLGTNLFPETLDLRRSAWGSGSGSTSRRFEDFIVEQVESQEPCTGLRFSGPVRFELPGEGGELFTGGFLELDANGRGSLLQGGDIVQVVEDYEIESTLTEASLTVRGEILGEVPFAIQQDLSLRDEFDRSWLPGDDDYAIVDAKAVDVLIGDLDGDGSVDFADFLMLSENFGTESEIGDLDGNGKVAFADFLILAAILKS